MLNVVNSHFPDGTPKTGKINSNVWTLAKLIRDSISHNKTFDYLDSKQLIAADLNKSGKSLVNSYFSFNVKEYDKKRLEEIFSPVEIVLLMLSMENELQE